VLLTRGVRPPRAVPTEAGWLLLEQGEDTLERHILATGTHWETQVVALLTANRDRLVGRAVIDVGGHVGFYALLLADLVGPTGAVVAVEAVDELGDRIRWARDRNRRPWLEVVPAAASDRNGTLALGLDPDRGHTTAAGSAATTFTVDAVRLDDWLADHRTTDPSLVLMDIEGGEVAALQGLEALLHRAAPDLVLEVHPEQLRDLGTSQEALLAWLTDIAPYDLSMLDHHRGLVPLEELPTAGSWHLLAQHAREPKLARPAG
jgi:FkbM family methyltransferase